MWRNHLALALRNLARNKFYSGISIVALAVGMCIAILIGLTIRSELSHEHFIAGYERTYQAVSVLTPQGRVPDYAAETHENAAALLQLKFTEIEASARLLGQTVSLRHASVEGREYIYWADPDIFAVLPLPVLSGNLQAALHRPDGLVLTRTAARKYFGRDNPIGETVQLDRDHLMTVAAVIEDLPAHRTRLSSGIFASALAPYSSLDTFGNTPPDGREGFAIGPQTYIRLKPQASLQPAMSAALDAYFGGTSDLQYAMQFVRIDRMHLHEAFNRGVSGRLAIAAATGFLVLLVAGVVFVNLATARAARRSLEVGIRKTCGAHRRTLLLQFLGEALICAALAATVAVALAELLLPSANAFLNSDATMDYRRDPALFVWIAAGTIVIGGLAGLYPAFVLSAFRPAGILRQPVGRTSGALVRQVLVTSQFAILIGLMIAAAVIYRQRLYATHEALRLDTDQVLMVRSPCDTAFKDAVRALPGVAGAFCSGEGLLTGRSFGRYRLGDGSVSAIDVVVIEPGLLQMYGLQPLQGHFFAVAPLGSTSGPDRSQAIVNAAAVSRLGFSSPAAAIGQPITELGGATKTIIGISADFSLYSAQETIRPTVYNSGLYGPRYDYQLINIKLHGREIPQTLAAIDGLWAATTGAEEPINRFFLDEHIQNLYLAMQRQAQAFALFSVVAVILACLGLIGLAAATTERRTREIGIRKSLGATGKDIVGLLLWQFSKPVLWANILAWPIGYLLMSGWLEGFAYRIDLQPWMFLAPSIVALGIAWTTVFFHSLTAARARPVHALGDQ